MQTLHFLGYWRDVADIALAALIFWGVLVWLRRTRAFFAFLGLAILAVVYLVARQVHFNLTAWIFQGFSAVLLILIVVVFQEDLRRLLEQIGAWGAGRRGPLGTAPAAGILAAAVWRMAEERTGALLVLPGKEPLERHLEGGVPLDGHLSESLLLSLFDPGSPGHDGAVVMAGQRVALFGCHLPLSTNQGELGPGGTRHAAALGLSERTDALCVVVSEERGTVSVARDGALQRIRQPDELQEVLREFGAGTVEVPTAEGWRRFFGPVWPYGAVALTLAVGLWFLLVPGSSTVEMVRQAPVVVENLPVGYLLESVEPERVNVTVSGPRGAVYLGPPDMIQVRIDAFLAQLGRRTFQVNPDRVDHPPGIEVRGISPSQVRISLVRPDEPQQPE
ncbi:MAG: diadenylate cyclase [Deferrisomatales bacterium]|nr:diadenylate cyclase [Deferrisomatales bacterium]